MKITTIAAVNLAPTHIPAFVAGCPNLILFCNFAEYCNNPDAMFHGPQAASRENDCKMNVSAIRFRSVRTDMIVNLAFAGLRAIVLVLLIRIAGSYLLPAILGLFLMSRRTAGAFAALLQGGVTQTLLRSVSLHFDDAEARRSYLRWTVALVAGAFAVFAPAGWYFRREFSGLVFGNGPNHDDLAFWTAELTIATAVSMIVSSILLALRKVFLSNLLQMPAAGAAALLALLYWGHGSTETIVTRDSGWITAAISLILLIYLAINLEIWRPVSTGRFMAAGRDFWNYGLSRGVSSFFDTFGMLVGPWLLRNQPVEVSHLIIALTLLASMQLIIGPLTQIVALHGIRGLGRDDSKIVAQSTRLTFGVALTAGLILTSAATPWLHLILQIWLGNKGLAQGAGVYADWMIFALTPIMVFYALRFIIEFRWVFPCNLITLTVGLFTMIASYAGGRYLGMGDREAVALGMFLMFCVQGLLTALWVYRDLPPPGYFGAWQLPSVLAILGGANLWAVQAPGIARVAVAMVASICALYVYFEVWPSPMIGEVKAKLLRRG